MNPTLICDVCSTELETYRDMVAVTKTPRLLVKPCPKCRAEYEAKVADAERAQEEAEHESEGMGEELSVALDELEEAKESLNNLRRKIKELNDGLPD